MAQNTADGESISRWQRNLLIITAIFTVMLIAMGGILCVNQSIRECPDWPGCFGRIYPPLEKGPVIEYTHRLLAGMSGLLVLASTIVGFTHKPRLRLLSFPPLVSGLLLLAVSYFGAAVVLRGLAPGWAAVDVGCALLVVALMTLSAVFASLRHDDPALPERLSIRSSFTRLALVTWAAVYIMLVSGVLVAGKNPLVGCLGWPVYSPNQFTSGPLTTGTILRLVLSIIALGLVIILLFQAVRMRGENPGAFRLERWLLVAFLLEALLQVLLMVFAFPIALWVAYTITAAVFWGLLSAVLARSSLENTGH